MNHKLQGVLALLAVVSTACIDDNYDLSDIDTTTRVQVNDLTLPVNIDAITLSDIITFDEDSKIKPVVIGGKEFYALSETGDFESDAIYINKVTADAPSLNPTEETLDRILPQNRAAGAPSSFAYTYNIVRMGNDLHYVAQNIDPSIDALYSARIEPLVFGVHLEALNMDQIADRMYFTDLVISMPKGLTATTSVGSYNPSSGIWTISSYVVHGNSTEATLTATAIDFQANGCQIVNHGLTLDSQFRVESGSLTIEPKMVGGIPSQLPASLRFRISYTLDDLTVNNLSGRINYKLAGMDIDPVSLSDIPDFLSGDQTNIDLVNPQIYLQVNNPVAGNDLDCSTGITLTAIREGAPSMSFSPDDGAFTIGHSRGVAGPYNFVLAPSENGLTTPDGYADGLRFVNFSNLSALIASPAGSAVKGLPQSIGIRLDDPQIPPQPVADFDLGRYIDGVKGKYELMAPIALREGSVIVYSDREDGWNDEDVDAITITSLTASCTVTNNCPLAVELTAYPIDIHGNRIPGVEVKSNTVEANKTDVPLDIVMTGTITHLDGVIYEARVMAGASGETLTPSQTIVLKNVRAKVSGYYEKEL